MKTVGWLLALLLLLAGGVVFYGFDFPRPTSNDMAPGLRQGDLLLACRFCGPPERGDVVFFSVPDHPGERSLARVVALPGDRVEVKRGQVSVNGAPLPSEKQPSAEYALDAVDPTPRPFEAAVESAGAHRYRTLRDRLLPLSGDRPAETLDGYFLLADRRTLAQDSRAYGPVGRSAIRARVFRVISAADGDPARQSKLP